MAIVPDVRGRQGEVKRGEAVRWAAAARPCCDSRDHAA